ncbi:YjgF-like protein [Ascodesmis nigricans]|uniref:YjgF-like protein n=1 Tax=Ascodesmis nigricans TaxID=341454 RepID=A0A4S2MIT2_9PEZI|nr:YjgF-like protein [Ascodesmis nigricans]
MPTTSLTGTSPYEPLFGYSRAVRRGNIIHVSGTTSIAPCSPPTESNAATSMRVLHPHSAYSQMHTALVEALRAVTALGGKREDVVRVRVFVKEPGDAAEVGRAMRGVMCGEGEGETGRQGAFAATMITGVQFVEKEMRVEVEVEAVVEE